MDGEYGDGSNYVLPRHARVRCSDPDHRDHQHAQGVGSVLNSHVRFGLGGGEAMEYEIAWDNVTSTQMHSPDLYRVYTREDWSRMRDQLRAELQHLRED